MSFYTKQIFFNNKKQRFFFENHAPKLGQLPSFLIVGLITIYQWTVSPDHGIFSIYSIGVCKHMPTCSQFTKEQIKKHGVMKGIKKGFKQVRKCY